MKLVIASKMNANEVKKIANFFNVISKGKLKTEIDPASEKSFKIPFNDKYEVKTLSIPLKDVGFNAKAAGSIFRFYSKNKNDSLIFISILVPGKFSFLEYKFEIYLYFAIKNYWDILMSEKFGKSAIPSEKIEHKLKIAKRMSIFIFEISCKNSDENTVNLVLQQVHTFLHMIDPDRHLAKFLSRSRIDIYKEPTDENEIADSYITLLNHNIKKDLKSHLSSFLLNLKISKVFLNISLILRTGVYSCLLSMKQL